LERELPFVQLFLKLDIPLDDRFVDAYGAREEAFLPELIARV
jgi:hypothetical protein